MPPTTAECTRLHGGDYAVCSDGTVWTRKSGEWKLKATWPEHGHRTVELYRHGERTRRRVDVLVRDAFGEDNQKKQNDDDLRWYLARQYDLDDDEIDAILNEENDHEDA